MLIRFRTNFTREHRDKARERGARIYTGQAEVREGETVEQAFFRVTGRKRFQPGEVLDYEEVAE